MTDNNDINYLMERLIELAQNHLSDFYEKEAAIKAIKRLHIEVVNLRFIEARLTLLENQITSLSNCLLSPIVQCQERLEENEKATKEYLKRLGLNQYLKNAGHDARIRHRLID